MPARPSSQMRGDARFISNISRTMKNFTKVAAAGAIATLLIPTLAFADNDRSKKSLEVRIEKGIERVEKKGDHDKRKEFRADARATSTAAAYSKQALRVQGAADTMLSFEARIAALIASSSLSEKASLEAKYAEFRQDALSAKTEAGKVVSAMAQVKAENSTTTNATLLAQAKVDLKESKSFLIEAKQALFSILRALWN